jgi:hypothetical protein
MTDCRQQRPISANLVPSTRLVNVRQSVPGVLVATGRNWVEISSGSATAAFNRAFGWAQLLDQLRVIRM